MELSEFRIWLEDQIAFFEREWRSAHRTEPAQYPISFPSTVEWQEQFEAWLETQTRK